jgi:RNA polymerase sigma-70 factor (ECF subfamily)
MFDKAVSYGLVWDFSASAAVDESQRWILSVMQKHGQELVTMLWRILGNDQDVCDAYQSTFLRLAHCQSGQKPRHVKAYIFRTASNVAVSMLRRKLVERRGLSATTAGARCTGTPYSGTVGSVAASPAHHFDSKCLQETLRCHIARLPEYLRDVITLHDLAELPYSQVGKILGITAATARVYRCKAVQLLSVWMSKERQE